VGNAEIRVVWPGFSMPPGDDGWQTHIRCCAVGFCERGQESWWLKRLVQWMREKLWVGDWEER